MGKRHRLAHFHAQARRRVARALWVADGRPVRDEDDPGSTGHQDYRDWTDAVLDQCAALGYTLTRPNVVVDIKKKP
jgi:hypothetical protein